MKYVKNITLSLPVKNLFFNEFQGLLRSCLKFAFPDNQNSPARLFQLLYVSAIPCHSVSKLGHPEISPRLRDGSANTPVVPMPEATVNKNHDPMFL